MKHTRIFVAGLVLFLSMLACLSPGAGPANTPVAPTEQDGPNLDATAEAKAIQAAVEATLQAQQDEQATAEAEAEVDDAATEQAAEETEAAEAQAQATQAKATERAEAQVTLTARAEATRVEATTEARALAVRVGELAEDGYITRTEGRYLVADDFSESWAQINWYQWWWTGYAPADFVVRAKFHWSSASNNANWFNSGCGFVFREAGSEPNDHYLAYLGLDGNVYLERARNGVLTTLASNYYGRVAIPEGDAQFLLAVDANKFTVFVNDTRVVTALDSGRSEGYLNYTLISGTNRDYGTLCEITDVEIWELAEAR